MNTLLWVLAGVLAYTAGVMWLRNQGLLPDAVRVSGPLTTVHTKRGRALLDRLAGPRRLWRAIANLGVGVALVVMVGAFVLLIFNAVETLANPPEPTGVHTPQNVLIIPGVNEFLPLSVAAEIVAGLLIALVVHEGAHGLLCRVEGIEIDSMGVALFTVLPIGAFVEPDEDSTTEADRGGRTRMFAAGVTANFVVTAVAFALLFGPIAGAVSAAPGAAVGGAYPGSPAADAGIDAGDRIVGVDGEAVANASELDARLDGSTARRVTVELADGSERTVDRALQVTAVAADSPFAAGGVEVNDTVVAVDGEAVHTERGFREAVGDDDVATIETDDGDTVTAPVGSLASVAPGGPFADAGAPTDRHLVVTRVGGERVYDHDDVSTALAPHDPGDEVTVVAYDGDDREEYAVTLGSADGGAYLGIRSALGASGVATDSLGVRSYPTDRFLAMFTGDAGGSIPGKLLVISLLPFLSVVDPTVEFNFAGFVGANAPFYEVTGPLGALGEPVVFLAANLLFWTGWINLQLGLFNCIPAFPLDGGRILRAATESVVSRLPLPEKRTVTRMVTTSVGLIMLVALLLMLFGPQLLN